MPSICGTGTDATAAVRALLSLLQPADGQSLIDPGAITAEPVPGQSLADDLPQRVKAAVRGMTGDTARPVRVMVTGEFRRGKSTLVNALLASADGPQVAKAPAAGQLVLVDSPGLGTAGLPEAGLAPGPGRERALEELCLRDEFHRLTMEHAAHQRAALGAIRKSALTCALLARAAAPPELPPLRRGAALRAWRGRHSGFRHTATVMGIYTLAGLRIAVSIAAVIVLSWSFCRPRREFWSLAPPARLRRRADRDVRAAARRLRHESSLATVALPGSVGAPPGRTCARSAGSPHRRADLHSCVVSRYSPRRWEAWQARAGEILPAEPHALDAGHAGRRAGCRIIPASRIPAHQVSCMTAATRQTTAISWALNGESCTEQNTRTRGGRQPGTGIRRTAGATPSLAALANARACAGSQ